MRRFLHTTLSLLCLALSSFAQEQSKLIEIYFYQDLYVIDSTINNNELSFRQFEQLYSDPFIEITNIHIESYASPEGGKTHNKILSENRTKATLNYLKNRFNLNDSLITTYSGGVAWSQLRDIVASTDMAHRDEVLNIIDNIPEETWKKKKPGDRYLSLVDSRNKRIMDLRGGRVYFYMLEHIYPALRKSAVVTVSYKNLLPELLPFAPVEHKAEEITIEQDTTTEIIIERVPLFAAKTNLLYDAVTAPQIEVEVPIGDKFSIAGEWIFPWWVASDNGSALEILSGGIELRYWLGNRDKKEKLTGWFGGLYAGGGLYDLQWNNNGYQGEFYIASGLSLGYAHTINKLGNLRMEYCLGVGYLRTNYRYYEGRQDNKYLVWQYDGVYSWIGPTKAKITFAWLLHKKREREVRR